LTSNNTILEFLRDTAIKWSSLLLVNPFVIICHHIDKLSTYYSFVYPKLHFRAHHKLTTTAELTKFGVDEIANEKSCGVYKQMPQLEKELH
jgi:FPC/CPF motif-containing protein YcgG